ncbi:SMI1/KNR4 family protein [Kitasatospora sp. NPDC056076]|uniref:SMI1/KNR4 family protein n=1 Tax=Kitasatospora sp. NPDC056076 TaxID=3345703 RepID=UPI0035D835D0
MSALNDFATWEPLLRLLRSAHAEKLAAPGGYVAGVIGRGSSTVPLKWRSPEPGRASLLSDYQAQHDAIRRVRAVVPDTGSGGVAFTVEIAPEGRAVLRLFDLGPAAGSGPGNAHPRVLVRVEGAVPEPWRRRPEPVPGVRSAPSVDPEALERTLRERIPGAIGATEEEIAAAEARLGVALPEEVKVLYRVTRARWEDWGGHEEAESVHAAVGFELSSLDHLAVFDASSRYFSWEHGAMEVSVTLPDAAVQDLVGSPGWIVIGGTGFGDQVAVDLTPGPRGHLGQVIVVDHEQSIGACLLAESLTDLVANPGRDWSARRSWDRLPFVARVHHRGVPSVEAAAHPDLEVLNLGVWDGEPFSLAPVLALPRLRTLSASRGTLADPREVGRLSGLEFVALTPEDWRVLLDAGAVPHSLSAAAITVNGDRDPRRTIALANEILALWDRPLITETVVHGDLGPLPTSGPESTAGRGGEPQPPRPAGERQGLGRVLPGLPGTPEPGPGPGADG